MIYSGPERGMLPIADEVDGIVSDQAAIITDEVVRDTPGYDDMPSEIQLLLRTAASKAAIAGLTEDEPSIEPLDPQDAAIVLETVMEEVGIGPSTAYVTHHDVSRAVEITIRQTQHMLQTGDVEYVTGNKRFEE